MSLVELIEFLFCFRGDCGMFVLKYIELLSAKIPLATCTSQNMPFSVEIGCRDNTGRCLHAMILVELGLGT